jgi:uncharacterized membrane protein
MKRVIAPAALTIGFLLASCGAPPAEERANIAEPAGAQPTAETDAANSNDSGPVGDSTGPEPTPREAAVSECLKQDGERIPANALKAIGTEPFWGARVEGRCVTYSTPEDQDGTRIWTKFSGSREQGVWTGYLDNQRFVLRTRPQPGCSDGMSDNRYPVAVTLTVRGEERTGCAELL